jgi:Na+-transporting NADH:ubiquinone oxidoreductase subunit NqrA
MRSFSPLAGEQVANPLFVGQPTGAGSTFTEQELDNFNFMLTSGSPATGQGATP